MFFSSKARKSFFAEAVHSDFDSMKAIALEEISPCETAMSLNLSFTRLCSAIVEHAHELEAQDDFRTAVHADLEELLHHHRGCPKCLQRRFTVMW
jgi:hypothetical protein